MVKIILVKINAVSTGLTGNLFLFFALKNHLAKNQNLVAAIYKDINFKNY